MNAVIQTQLDTAAIAISLLPVPEVKYCSNCSTALSEHNGRRTSFGLNLCDDCLYS